MKKTVYLLLILLLPAHVHAMSASELAGKLQESYDKTCDLKASFSQVSEVKAMNIVRYGKGKLSIKKPGMLRYTYTEPEKQEIIVRGEELIMYMPETNQVVKRKLSRAMVDKTPATFLAGLGKVTDSFVASIPKTGEKDDKGNLALLLTPKGEKAGVENVLLSLEPKTYNIRSFSFTDISGNTNTITLENIKVNEGVDEKTFDFKIPKDARLITE